MKILPTVKSLLTVECVMLQNNYLFLIKIFLKFLLFVVIAARHILSQSLKNITVSPP